MDGLALNFYTAKRRLIRCEDQTYQRPTGYAVHDVHSSHKTDIPHLYVYKPSKPNPRAYVFSHKFLNSAYAPPYQNFPYVVPLTASFIK